MRKYAVMTDRDGEQVHVIYQDPDEDRDIWYIFTPVDNVPAAKEIVTSLNRVQH